MLADSGVPMAFRVCEHWFGRLFTVDQFLRELAPARRSPPRAAWALGCRAFNRAVPSLRLDPLRRFDAAISWNSEAIRRMAGVPGVVTLSWSASATPCRAPGPATRPSCVRWRPSPRSRSSAA